MTIEMGYTCSCGVTWTTDNWPLVEAHLNTFTGHVVTEGYFHSDHNSGVPTTSVCPATAAPGSGFDVIIRTNPRVTAVQLKEGCLTGLFESVGDLPSPPTTIPGWAFVDNGTSFPDVAWWQVGSTDWDNTLYPYPKPVDPLGIWALSLNAYGTGNNNWTSYSMGTELRIKAAGAGGSINAVAFQHGSSGAGAHAWALFKSSVVSATAPATATYSSVATGTFTVTNPGEWHEVTLSPAVTVAENEWYAVMMWVGAGGQSASLSTFQSAGLVDETYVVINGGIYAPGATSTAPGSNPTPTNRSAATLYGIATLRITL